MTKKTKRAAAPPRAFELLPRHFYLPSELSHGFGNVRNFARRRKEEPWQLWLADDCFQFRPQPRRGNMRDRAKGRRRAAATGIHSILIVVHWDCQIRR
jgi:hypothetical protein